MTCDNVREAGGEVKVICQDLTPLVCYRENGCGFIILNLLKMGGIVCFVPNVENKSMMIQGFVLNVGQ